MNSGQARNALYQMFKDVWDDPTFGWAGLGIAEPAVYYDNVRGDGNAPRADKVKLEISVYHDAKPTDSFGAGRPTHKAEGFVVVKVYTPKDTGLTLSDDLVNIVKRAFQAKRGTGVADSLVLRGMNPSEEGALDRWYLVRAVTPFEYEDEVI